MSLIGCCAVLEPRKLQITYIELDTEESVQADFILERARAGLAQLRSSGKAEPETVTPTPHVEPGQQQLLGTLTAALAEIALSYEDHPGTKPLALAIHKLRPMTAFIIKATRETQGTTTEFIDVECDDPAKAKEAIEARTEIKMLRDFQTLSAMTGGSPKLG